MKRKTHSNVLVAMAPTNVVSAPATAIAMARTVSVTQRNQTQREMMQLASKTRKMPRSALAVEHADVVCVNALSKTLKKESTVSSVNVTTSAAIEQMAKSALDLITVSVTVVCANVYLAGQVILATVATQMKLVSRQTPTPSALDTVTAIVVNASVTSTMMVTTQASTVMSALHARPSVKL